MDSTRLAEPPHIGVVGAGLAGCHLALYLQQHGVPVTLYAERSPQAVRNGRLLNTAFHYGKSVQHERELGVNFWDGPIVDGQEWTHPGFGVRMYIGQGKVLSWWGALDTPGTCIDQRVTLPKYVETFIERGGDVVVEAITAERLAQLTQRHDFVVVSTGRGSLAELFPRNEPFCPYSKPRRLLCSGVYRGVSAPLPRGVIIGACPGVGELFEMPILTRDGPYVALFFEIVPGSEFEYLMKLNYDADPRQFEAGVLEGLARFYPQTLAERVDVATFGLKGPLDLLQGAVVPTARRGYTRLANGKYVGAIGDTFTVQDPLNAQGANSAVHTAHVMGRAICDERRNRAFDEHFCRLVEEEMWSSYVRAATLWTNVVVGDDVPERASLFAIYLAAGCDQRIADAWAMGYSPHPEKNWSVIVTPERMASFLRQFGWAKPPSVDDVIQCAVDIPDNVRAKLAVWKQRTRVAGD
jgi:2-polyprenyl-6-methoxyphenol hydroxylase-like FAD-dependent oxidoreductase